VTMTAPARPAMPPSDHTPRPYTGPSKQEVLAMRRQYCHPSTFLYYREPLMVVEGFMQYLYDETGRRYLDMFAGIVTVSCGHSHPKFVERVKAQVAASNVFTRDSAFYQAMQMGMLETVGLDWRLLDRSVERVRAVTAAQVQAVAKKYLTDSNLTVTVLDPQPGSLAVEVARAA